MLAHLSRVLLEPVLAAVQAQPGFSAGELSMLAILQGLTEFLPISSSGHLALAGKLLAPPEGAAPGALHGTPLWLEVALHLGTLAAVLIVYRHSIRDILRDLARARPREALYIALATAPVGVVGILGKDAVERAAHSETFVACGLVGTAAILAVGEWARRRQRPIGPREPRPLDLRAAILVGLAQTVAILPGVSRSGTTIAAGLACGLAPAQAARFSFLLSIPAILGAAVVTAKDIDTAALGELGAGAVLWAIGLAALVGWGSLRVLIAFLGRGAFLWFAAYCALLGLGWLAFG